MNRMNIDFTEEELRQQGLSQRVKELEEAEKLSWLIIPFRSSLFDLPPEQLTDEQKAKAREGWEILRIKAWESLSLKETMKCLLLASEPHGRTSLTDEQKAKAREGWKILRRMMLAKAVEPKVEVASPEGIAKGKGAGDAATLKAAADAEKNKARLRKERIAKEYGYIQKRR
jgi:hypothetical protein